MPARSGEGTENCGKLARAERVARSLGALFQHTGIPVIAVEPSGEFVAANDAAIAQYGYPVDELLEMRIQDLQAFGRDVAEDLARAATSEHAALERRPHRKKDGTILWVVPTASPIDIEGKRLVVSVLTDVTALAAAENKERAMRLELVGADRLAAIGRLAAGVAHEVNNPAAFVTLALQRIQDAFARPQAREGAAQLVDEAIAAMLQINQIMRDLTGFARERARAPLDLGVAANSAIRIAAHETRHRAVVERVHTQGVVAEVRGARIAQVVLNLVINAAQAIPAGAPNDHRIDVRVYRSGDRACIDVSDTGPGVARDLGERIFEPFFTTRESSGGTGLGLWLSRSIIEEEGGTLTYENLPRGGACFTISLPAYRAEELSVGMAEARTG